MKALKIKETDSLLIKSDWVNTSGLAYYLNGVELNNNIFKHGFTVSLNDKFTVKQKNKVLGSYKRGEKTISVEDYRNKHQYYYESSSEEETLRAIANRKELKGFEACYIEDEQKPVEFEVIGYVEDTGSRFISCSLTSKFEKHPQLYFVDIKGAAIDEYNILSKKYESHASFEIPEKTYLRYTKINNNYVFGDSKPFGDFKYNDAFVHLGQAKEAEHEAREAVRNVIKRVVFPEVVTKLKALNMLSNLRMLRDLDSSKAKSEALDILINDLKKYVSYSE